MNVNELKQGDIYLLNDEPVRILKIEEVTNNPRVAPRCFLELENLKIKVKIQQSYRIENQELFLDGDTLIVPEVKKVKVSFSFEDDLLLYFLDTEYFEQYYLLSDFIAAEKKEAILNGEEGVIIVVNDEALDWEPLD